MSTISGEACRPHQLEVRGQLIIAIVKEGRREVPVALHARVGYHKTLVAIANKHARMIWALLAKGEAYDPTAWQRYVPSIN